MQVIVLGEEAQRAELERSEGTSDAVWVNRVEDFLEYRDADAFIDLGFVNNSARKAVLERLLLKPVVIHSVAHTLAETNPAFVRINAWNTFLSSPVIEASALSENTRLEAEEAFSVFGRKIQWIPDQTGFITTRIVSMIINEAFIALEEGVSTEAEIDTAMKLGTAYPFGPFEWAEKIGLQNIATLLNKLAETQPRYRPSESLLGKAKGLI